MAFLSLRVRARLDLLQAEIRPDCLSSTVAELDPHSHLILTAAESRPGGIPTPSGPRIDRVHTSRGHTWPLSAEMKWLFTTTIPPPSQTDESNATMQDPNSSIVSLRYLDRAIHICANIPLIM